VKSPVEFILGAVQSAWPGPIGTGALVEPLQKMGQELCAPPNVKGWPGGRDWLNTSTLLARNNFADHVASGGRRPVRRRGRIPTELDRDLAEAEAAAAELEERKKSERGPARGFAEPEAELETGYAPKDPPAAFDLARRFGKADPTRRADIADTLLATFLPGGASPRTRAAIIHYIDDSNPKDALLRERIREAAHAIMCSAEYQLC
jgi:hypothetical protein